MLHQPLSQTTVYDTRGSVTPASQRRTVPSRGTGRAESFAPSRHQAVQVLPPAASPSAPMCRRGPLTFADDGQSGAVNDEVHAARRPRAGGATDRWGPMSAGTASSWRWASIKRGAKHPLGLWEGSAENTTVCQGLLTNLQSRRLRTGPQSARHPRWRVLPSSNVGEESLSPNHPDTSSRF